MSAIYNEICKIWMHVLDVFLCCVQDRRVAGEERGLSMMPCKSRQLLNIHDRTRVDGECLSWADSDYPKCTWFDSTMSNQCMLWGPQMCLCIADYTARVGESVSNTKQFALTQILAKQKRKNDGAQCYSNVFSDSAHWLKQDLSQAHLCCTITPVLPMLLVLFIHVRSNR